MFIKITPEGYTPDGKYRLVPVDIMGEIHSVYHHAMGQGLREQDKRGVLAFHKSVIETAPPPPAEMLVEESALKDAARWRHLREMVRTKEGMVKAQAMIWNCSNSRKGLDAAIDAERGK